ncbi:hypothetical protein CHARACLAT_031949 [Characodon lateralis]|uniref:Uncharacterized protein n=1 Tax=Characodon lateralis TaxID=208331 RepID=A0ABU7DVX1_9TELE|nr:hypothetical protein [Characodon lateralis]
MDQHITLDTLWTFLFLMGCPSLSVKYLRLPSQIIYQLFLTLKLATSCHHYIQSPAIAGQFTTHFKGSQLLASTGLHTPFYPHNFLSSFYESCNKILDSVTPIMLKTFQIQS